MKHYTKYEVLKLIEEADGVAIDLRKKLGELNGFSNLISQLVEALEERV